jgi:hypothetical protein
MLNLNLAEVRRFWRAATQHLRVARRLAGFGNQQILWSEEAFHAIYIGGYAVECGLKALYLSRMPVRRHRATVEKRFRELGHNLEGLYHSLNSQFGTKMTPDVLRQFRTYILATWSVGNRYNPGQARRRMAIEFLDAVETVLTWIEGA